MLFLDTTNSRETLMSILEFLHSEANDYERQSNHAKKKTDQVLGMARCNALRLAIVQLENSNLARTDYNQGGIIELEG
jgi:hypothetical protein